MVRSDPREWKKWDMNSDPRSEEMCRGMPCLAKTWVTNASATSTAVTVSIVGIKILSLERQSIFTRTAMNPLDGGSCTMKSMLMECQGCYRIGSGCSKPKGRC